MQRFVFATLNQGKIREVKGILEGLAIEVVSASEAGLESLPEETGLTFLDNAVIKALAAMESTGLPSFGDDSGLEVACLGGAPGVHSARFAGEARDDAANIRKLLEVLRDKPDRRARFVCTVACILDSMPMPEVRARLDAIDGLRILDAHPLVSDGSPVLVATGFVEGCIIDVARGTDGFGYDPVFWLDDLGRTFAEIPTAEKNALSHRGRAFGILRRGLEAVVRS
jgi:XTP/dITP diphosphohydrolase